MYFWRRMQVPAGVHTYSFAAVERLWRRRRERRADGRRAAEGDHHRPAQAISDPEPHAAANATAHARVPRPFPPRCRPRFRRLPPPHNRSRDSTRRRPLPRRRPARGRISTPHPTPTESPSPASGPTASSNPASPMTTPSPSATPSPAPAVLPLPAPTPQQKPSPTKPNPMDRPGLSPPSTCPALDLSGLDLSGLELSRGGPLLTFGGDDARRSGSALLPDAPAAGLKPDPMLAIAPRDEGPSRHAEHRRAARHHAT